MLQRLRQINYYMTARDVFHKNLIAAPFQRSDREKREGGKGEKERAGTLIGM